MVVRELVNKVVFSVTGVKEAEAAVQKVKNQLTRSETAGTKASAKISGGMANVGRSAAMSAASINRVGTASTVAAATGTRRFATLRANLTAVGDAALATSAKIRSMAAARIPGSLGGSKEPTDGGGFGMPGMGKIMAAVGAFSGASAIKNTADEVMNLDGRLRAVTKTDEERLAIENQIYETAQKDRQSFTAMGDLYTKVARAGNKMGYSSDQNLRVTDIVSKALTAGGASTAESQSTILQLGQALQSGALQGDELASLRENGGTLMEHMAAALGTDMAGLKEMGSRGELTSQKVMDAILAAGGAIDEEFSKMPMTIGQAFTRIGNGWDKFIMEVERRTGTFSRIAQGISGAFDTAVHYVDIMDQLYSGNIKGGNSFSDLAAEYPVLNALATRVFPAMRDIFSDIAGIATRIGGYWDALGGQRFCSGHAICRQ